MKCRTYLPFIVKSESEQLIRDARKLKKIEELIEDGWSIQFIDQIDIFWKNSPI